MNWDTLKPTLASVLIACAVMLTIYGMVFMSKRWDTEPTPAPTVSVESRSESYSETYQCDGVG